jgi:hypothetical protein
MRTIFALLLCFVPLAASGALAAPASSFPHVPAPYACVKNFYVDGGGGSDANSGRSPGKAWRTIGRAVRNFYGRTGLGGVCVNVAPGTYPEYLYLGFMGGSSDSPTGYLVFRSAEPLQAKITLPADQWSRGHNTVIQYSSYIIFDGFEEYTQNSQASANNGFFVQGKPGRIAHHVKIINCLIHDTGAAAIGAADYTDYITASGNVIYNTAGYINGSAIGIYEAYAVDSAPGFHNYFTNNKIYHNRNLGDFEHTEGAGIIIDTLNHYSYSNSTLIENNIIYENGGPCINVYKSNYVTVRFNSCYHNNQDASITYGRGEIDAIQANNTIIANNIAYAAPGPPAGVHALDDDPQGQGESGNIWVNNLAFGLGSDGSAPAAASALAQVNEGGAAITASNGNILGLDPLFKSPPQDLSLKAGSPAIGAATSAHGMPSTDADMKMRAAERLDLGALAFTP